MSQASSVQREPSMEEILASIRRIIEDSDGIRKPEQESSRPGPGQSLNAPPIAEVETFRAELGPVAAGGTSERVSPLAAGPAASPARLPEPAQVTELPPRPFRLADVQAQVVRDAEAQPKPVEADRKPVTLADVKREIAKDLATVEPMAASAEPVVPPVSQARPEVPARAAPVEPTVDRPAPKTVAAKAAEPFAASWERVEEAPPQGNGLAMRLDMAAKPIISPIASRQVAAAFGELSEAFAARSKKTFDEMAEQLLRPMLQEWLDNNLPVLVERLVREEIERVARGV